jgi:hypothetical protein
MIESAFIGAFWIFGLIMVFGPAIALLVMYYLFHGHWKGIGWGIRYIWLSAAISIVANIIMAFSGSAVAAEAALSIFFSVYIFSAAVIVSIFVFLVWAVATRFIQGPIR